MSQKCPLKNRHPTTKWDAGSRQYELFHSKTSFSRAKSLRCTANSTRARRYHFCTSSISFMMIGIASVWSLAFMAAMYLSRFS